MSVRRLGALLAKQLHEKLLKEAGFKKKGNSFSRAHDGFEEMFVIDGSQWNSGREPWRFQLTTRVRFTDIGPLRTQTNKATFYHAHGTADSLVPGSPQYFDLSESNMEQTVEEVGALVLALSKAIPPTLPEAHKRAMAGYSSFLPVPETWRD